MLFKKQVLALATVMSVALSPSLFAGGPFGLFDGCNQSCDAMCGSSCDSCASGCCDSADGGCCDSSCDSPCGKSRCSLLSCGLFGKKSCGGCDSASCDGGCCDSGCDSPCSSKSRCSLLSCGLFGNKGCDSGCNSCDSGSCDGGCDSGCDSMGCLGGGCGSYCSVFGGFNVLDNYSGIAAPTTQLEGTFNDGLAVGFAKGRRFGDSIRGELEFSFRSNTADKWSVNGASDDWSGHVFGYSGMANLYYDLHSCKVFGITPYSGAGIGLAVIDGSFTTNMTKIDIEDESFAYQFISGASKQINSNVAAFAEYRYYVIDEIDVTNVGVTPVANLGSDDIEMDTFFFGLRFTH